MPTSYEQKMTALERANYIRTFRHQFKLWMNDKTNEKYFAAFFRYIISSCPDWLANWRCINFIGDLPGIGPVRVDLWLRRLDISRTSNRTMGELKPTQILVLLNLVMAQYAKSSSYTIVSKDECRSIVDELERRRVAHLQK